MDKKIPDMTIEELYAKRVEVLGIIKRADNINTVKQNKKYLRRITNEIFSRKALGLK